MSCLVLVYARTVKTSYYQSQERELSSPKDFASAGKNARGCTHLFSLVFVIYLRICQPECLFQMSVPSQCPYVNAVGSVFQHRGGMRDILCWFRGQK